MADKLLEKILDGLDEQLNPNTFELCANELIRKDYPATVPVVGGSDSGMDGAVADLEGEAFPIVCTTAENVIGNLTDSLQSYLDNGNPRRKVISVTSRQLSPQQQQNLKDRAREMGFILVQIYERQAIAERLRESPRWCKELLDVTVDLPALSEIPPHFRSESWNLELVGRSEELQWLQNLSSDALLTGQPGSGKTALLKKIADSGHALFVCSDNSDSVTASFRELKPKIVILDDAHVHEDRFELLLRIRLELKAEFKILAAVWPNKVDEWKIKLKIGNDQVKELRLLTRDQIVEVINSVGIKRPDNLIREIVNQAEGKPGLAVLLSSLCLKGDIKKFSEGSLLSTFILSSLASATGKQIKEILAAFSIGGDWGMKSIDVASFLGIPQLEVARAVAELDAAGVITEVGDCLSVRPPTLRFALVRDVFFSGPKSLNAAGLLATVPDVANCTLTLLGAAHRGANIPLQQLLDGVVQSDSEEAWSAFGWLGNRQTEKLLEQFPDCIMYYLEPALHFNPQKALPLLFQKAVGDDRQLHSHPGHPLRKIQDWIEHTDPNLLDPIKAREELLDGVIAWLKTDRDPSVAFRILPASFSPNFGSTSMDPGAGRTFKITSGTLGSEDINGLENLWIKLMDFLKSSPKRNWKAILDVVHTVAYPGREISPTAAQSCKRIAQMMINDLGTLAKGQPGVIRSLRDFAERKEFEGPEQENNLFALLYPESELGNPFPDEKFKRNVEEVVGVWKSLSPQEVSVQILETDAAAKVAEIRWPRLTNQVCWRLAEQLSNPLEWAEGFAKVNVPSDCVTPFVVEAVKRSDLKWIAFASANLHSYLQHELMQISIIQPICKTPLWNELMPVLSKYPESVEMMARQMPIENLIEVLQHPDPAVRGHLAVGEWNFSKHEKKEVRKEAVDLWRLAIIDFSEDEYWLREILPSDPELAFLWVQKRFQSKDRISYETDKLIRSLCPRLSIEQRKELLKILPGDDYYASDIFLALIGLTNELCSFVLNDAKFVDFIPELARRTSTEVWAERVLMLRKHGLSAKDISYNVLERRQGWTGNESDMWKGKLESIKPLAAHENPAVREVAGFVIESIEFSIKRAMDREYRDAVLGRG